MSRLSEKAMLVTLSISMYKGRHRDKQTSDEVLTKKNASKDAGAWWTRSIPKEYIATLEAIANKGRKIHNRYSLPWNNDGQRVLSADAFLDYTKEMRECRAEYEKAVDEFLKQYPEIIKKAKERLGDLFDSGRFPDQSSISSKFRWNVSILPMPDVNDFRVKLVDGDAKKIKEEMEEQIQETLALASREIWERLYKVVKRMADRLSEPKGVFRDTLITNVRSLCDILPKLNITKDKELELMRREIIRKLSKKKPDELRENKKERKQTAKAADEILKRIDQFLVKG